VGYQTIIGIIIKVKK